jgi:hypothetical protein
MILNTTPTYLVDIIAAVVAAVQSEVLGTIQANETAVLNSASRIQKINYQYGHPRELIQTLSQNDLSPQFNQLKYPLIYLYMDFREQRGRTPGIYADTQLNFAICHQTEGDYKAADRYVNVFKPVLYPIYYSLMKQLTKSPLTVQGDQDMLQHDKWDRMFWGTSKVVGGGGTDRSYLNDFVDAIEIQNLALKINYQPCVTPAYPQAAGS